jgi:hypothetical protein
MAEEVVVDEVVAVEPEAPLTDNQLPTLNDAELEKAISNQGTITKEKETAATPVKPEVKVEPKPVTPAPVEKPEDVQVMKERLEKLEKQVNEKEKVLQRQGTEIGELRKARAYYEEQAKTLYAQFQEKFYENPSESMQAYNQSAQAVQQAQQIEAVERIQVNKQYIYQAYPEYDTMINDIAEYGKAIGVPDEQVENFKRNPYSTDVRALIPYVEGAKRMKAEKTNNELIEQLRKQVEELDKETDEETVVQKIALAAKKGTVITAKSGDGTTKVKTDGLNETNIPDITDADLDALLKEAK